MTKCKDLDRVSESQMKPFQVHMAQSLTGLPSSTGNLSFHITVLTKLSILG